VKFGLSGVVIIVVVGLLLFVVVREGKEKCLKMRRIIVEAE